MSYPSPLFSDTSKSWRPQRPKAWHDRIIDLLLVDPTIEQKEIAAQIGRSEVAVSYVMGSDMFKARYEARRQLINETLANAITGKLTRLAVDAIEITHEKLKLQRDKLPFEDLVDVTDKTLARLGYGTKQAGPNVVINNNAQQITAPISAEELESIRAKLRADQQKTIDGIPASGGGAQVLAPIPLAVEVRGEEAAVLAETGPLTDDSPELEQL